MAVFQISNVSFINFEYYFKQYDYFGWPPGNDIGFNIAFGIIDDWTYKEPKDFSKFGYFEVSYDY
jgi:hypothetical protein